MAGNMLCEHGMGLRARLSSLSREAYDDSGKGKEGPSYENIGTNPEARKSGWTTSACVEGI